MCCNWLNVGGDHVERNVDSFCELRAMPPRQVARKQEPQSCNHRTWIVANFCQHQEWAWTQIFPESLQTVTQPDWHLDCSLGRPWAENLAMPCWTSDLQDCKLINGCCFKFVVICYAVENEYILLMSFFSWYTHYYFIIFLLSRCGRLWGTFR